MITKCYIIPTQKTCNCDCDFCISKDRNYNKDIEFLLPNDEFKLTIQLLKERGINRFEITGGGEPLLNKNIQKIINIIRIIIPNAHIKLYTNGNILKPINNIDELDISVVHYDQEVNDKIMHPKKSCDLITKLKWFRSVLDNCKIRLSIPLMKDAIASKEQLSEMIKLTSGLVDEYVVRTLYPKTRDIQKNYVDFEYNHSLVKMERDNDVKEFDGLIIWSDGKIYNNWQLNETRNLEEKGYILLKPDSQPYINEIEKLITNENFTILNKYFIDDFVNNALKLYQDKLVDINYYNKVKKHLEVCAYLFGNVGLILLLGKYKNYEELVKDIYKLKSTIRETYSFTGSKGGYIKTDDGMSHLNLVHAPDPDPSFYKRDISLIDNDELKHQEVGDEWTLVKKYCSYRR